MSKLQDIRKQRFLSQNKLVSLSGVSHSLITKYESGEKDINKAAGITLYRMASVLGCAMEDLLENTEGTIDNIDNNIIADCMDTEMSESCHDDYIEDYDSPLEFYLSNVERGSYIGYLINTYNVTEERALRLQDLIRWNIKNKVEDE